MLIFILFLAAVFIGIGFHFISDTPDGHRLHAP